jgi:hypothetical protein
MSDYVFINYNHAICAIRGFGNNLQGDINTGFWGNPDTFLQRRGNAAWFCDAAKNLHVSYYYKC